MKFTEIMSVNEFEGCVRCWTCKSSGIDRFFEGNAERQLHENSMHSSIYQHKNYTRKGTTSDFAIDCGSSFRKNVQEADKQKDKTKPYFTKGEKLQEKKGEDFNTIKYKAVMSPETDSNERNMRSFDKTPHSITHKGAVVDSKKTMDEKLREDLENAEKALMLSKRREATLEDQLQFTRRELEEAKKQLKPAEAERLQHLEMKKNYEGRLKYQKMYIMKLRKERQSEQMALKRTKDNEMTVINLKRQLRSCKIDLASAKQLKAEAKTDKEKLLAENKDMKEKLKRYQQDLEELESEHIDLIKECKRINHSEDLQKKLLETKEFFHKKLNDERMHFAENIEEYTKQYEKLELKCHTYKRRLRKSLQDLKAARSELDAAQIYRQPDTDRLLKEKESPKLFLKTKKNDLQDLESSNKMQVTRLKEKEEQINEYDRKQWCNLNRKNDDCLRLLSVLFDEKCILVEELQDKLRNFEPQPLNHTDKEMPFIKIDQNKVRKANTIFKRKLQMLEEEQKLKDAEIHALKSRSNYFEESFIVYEEEIRTLQEALYEALRENEMIESELDELRKNLDSKNKETLEDVEKQSEAIDDKGNGKLNSLENELKSNNVNFDTKSKGKGALEESFEVEHKELNEKLNKVLEVTDETKEKCIQLEVLLREKEAFIKQLHGTMEMKQSNTPDANDTRESNNTELDGDLCDVDGFGAKIAKERTDLEICLDKSDKNGYSIITPMPSAKEDCIDIMKHDAENSVESSPTEKEKTSNGTNAKDKKLEKANKTSATEQGQILEMSMKSLEILNRDIELTKEEEKQLQAMKNSLIKTFQENEQPLKINEKKFKEIEDAYIIGEKIQSEAKPDGKEDQKIKAFENLENDKKIIQILLNDNTVSLSENESLRSIIGDSEFSISPKNSKKLGNELKGMQEALESMRKREKKIQSHNYELKKRLDKEETIRTVLKDEIVSFSKYFKRYKSKETDGDSETEKLIKEVEKWQRKLGDLILTVYEVESNIEIATESSVEMTGQFESENETLQAKIDKANLAIKKKLSLLEKRSENWQDLSSIVVARNAEIKAKNKELEEVDEQNRKMVAEIRHLERKIRDLEENIEFLESEKDELQQGEKSIGQQFRNACEEIKLLKIEKEKLRIKCEKLQKPIVEDKKTEKAHEIVISVTSEGVPGCSFETDFHSDDSDEGNSKNSKCQMLEDEGNSKDLRVESDNSVNFWDIISNEKSFEEYFSDRSEAEADDHISLKVISKENTMEPKNGVSDINPELNHSQGTDRRLADNEVETWENMEILMQGSGQLVSTQQLGDKQCSNGFVPEKKVIGNKLLSPLKY